MANNMLKPHEIAAIKKMAKCYKNNPLAYDLWRMRCSILILFGNVGKSIFLQNI